MENITAVQLWAMQDKFCDLYFDIYGYRPDFGTVSDWNDIGWVTRMYNDLRAEFHSLPEELDLPRSKFWSDLNRRQLLRDAERYVSWASADIERGDLKSARFYQRMAQRALAGWESIQV